MGSEEVASSAGLITRTECFTSQPDGNSVQLQFIRPITDDSLPCVYYIHGGGMMTQSCYDGHYRASGRMIASRGDRTEERRVGQEGVRTVRYRWWTYH